LLLTSHPREFVPQSGVARFNPKCPFEARRGMRMIAFYTKSRRALG
jgi:hypothetical protein